MKVAGRDSSRIRDRSAAGGGDRIVSRSCQQEGICEKIPGAAEIERLARRCRGHFDRVHCVAARARWRETGSQRDIRGVGSGSRRGWGGIVRDRGDPVCSVGCKISSIHGRPSDRGSIAPGRVADQPVENRDGESRSDRRIKSDAWTARAGCPERDGSAGGVARREVHRAERATGVVADVRLKIQHRQRRRRTVRHVERERAGSRLRSA